MKKNPAIEKDRLQYAIMRLVEEGFDVHYEDKSSIKFMHDGSEVTFFPYTGWATGRKIKDGRGIENLIKQIK